MGVISGGVRVEAPFAAPGVRRASDDVEESVRWYRSLQAKGLSEPQDGGHAFGDLEREERMSQMVMPWGRELQTTLLRLRNVAPDSGWAAVLQGRAGLFRALEAAGVFRGPQALLVAVSALLGGEEHAQRLFLGDAEGSGQTLLEFAGALTALGVDPEVVCGLDERAIFQLASSDGRARLKDIAELKQPLAVLKQRLDALNNSAPEEPSAPSDGPFFLSEVDVEPGTPAGGSESRTSLEDVSAAQFKWVRIARWMASGAVRRAALSEERYRRGWRVQREPEGLGLLAALGAVPPEALPAEGRFGSWSAELCSGRESPSRLALASAAVMREQERTLKAFFSASAGTVAQDGSRLMSSSDWLDFCSDLAMADTARSGAAGEEGLQRCFQEAFALQQCQAGTRQQRECLVFASFKVALAGLGGALGLDWRPLLAHVLGSASSAAQGDP